MQLDDEAKASLQQAISSIKQLLDFAQSEFRNNRCYLCRSSLLMSEVFQTPDVVEGVKPLPPGWVILGVPLPQTEVKGVGTVSVAVLAGDPALALICPNCLGPELAKWTEEQQARLRQEGDVTGDVMAEGDKLRPLLTQLERRTIQLLTDGPPKVAPADFN